MKNNVIYTIIYFIIFSIVWQNLVQIGSLVTEIKMFVENVFLILYNINLIERFTNMKKSSSAKHFQYLILPQYTKSCLNRATEMFDTFLPIFMALICVMDGFSRGMFFSISMPKLSAKFDCFIRDLNDRLIFDHNSPDQQ